MLMHQDYQKILNLQRMSELKRKPGRPPATDKATLLITIKATPAQKAKFLELGGSRWVKRLLDKAAHKNLES